MVQPPKWSTSLNSYVWIFSVGRGLSIFIRTALNQGIFYDCGSSQEFSPCLFLQDNILPYLDEYRNCKVAQSIISHPHSDHISEISYLANGEKTSKFYSSLHTCPHHKVDGSEKPEALNWNRIDTETYQDNINLYKKLYESRSLPLQTINYESDRLIPNLEYGIYYVRPPFVDKIHPTDDQDYGNGVSIVLYYRQGQHTLLLPGDITPESLDVILDESAGSEKRYTIFDKQKSENHPQWFNKTCDQPSLKYLLNKYGLTFLVAPHHGLESGFSDYLYDCLKDGKPNLVVISEKRHVSENDGSIDPIYLGKDGASGIEVNVGDKTETRFSVSTRNGHHILIIFNGTGAPKVLLENDPYKLLKKIGG